MFDQIVSRTKRVPVNPGSVRLGSGEVLTRQLDIALMNVGWKLSTDLFVCLANQEPAIVKDIGPRLISCVNKLLGNKKHNVYFVDFPNNVPDTESFWMQLVYKALSDSKSASVVGPQLASGFVNLLDLPGYGRYLHTYEDMVKNHEQFVPDLKANYKILHLGKTLQEETVALYQQLAGSSVPLNEDDRKLIEELAVCCLDSVQPKNFPVRENKAVVNSVRLVNNRPLLVDTVTDVLRLACHLSGGDVTLQKPTKFKSFSRSTRRALFGALASVLNNNYQKMMDVKLYQEEWKRLGEKLHSHEAKDQYVRDMFAIARGDFRVVSDIAKFESALTSNKFEEAVNLISNKPGVLFRSLDRLMMIAGEEKSEILLRAVRSVVSKVSGRVLLGVWEHFLNVSARPGRRIFSNSKGTSWTQDETRLNIPENLCNALIDVFKGELRSRFMKMGISELKIENDAMNIAVPLSEKNKSTGFGVLPKGSVVPVNAKRLRFFVYWKQKQARTDYDLTSFFMDENFTSAGFCSWTSLRHGGSGNNEWSAVHSGDITDATNGASEFIEINLDKVAHPYIVAQINRYAGEDFNQTEESFFGFMERTAEQQGLPYEPKTVKVKSEVRGDGKVAIPALFFRDSSESWNCKWLDFQLQGHAVINMIERNSVSTAMLIQAVVNRKNLTMKDLAELLPGTDDITRTAYVGFQKPDNFEKNYAKVFTLDNLASLIPE